MLPGTYTQDALQASHELAARLEAQLSRLADHDARRFPLPARELARLAHCIAKKLLADTKALLAVGTADVDSVRALLGRHRSVERLHDLVEQSTHRALHPVLAPTVSFELSRFSVDGLVLVSGTRDLSYEIETVSLPALTSLLEPADLATFSPTLRIFRVPYAPLEWPLHHALVYHEIGHALFALAKWAPASSVPAEFNPATTADMWVKLRRTKGATVFASALESWAEEMYADAVGLMLAGPAYYASMCRFLGTHMAIDAASASHPPTSLRIELGYGLLCDLGFSLPPATEALAKSWHTRALAQTTVRWASHDEEGFGSQYVQHLTKAIRAQHAAITTAAKNVVGSHAYLPEAFNADLSRAELFVEHQIPPIDDENGEALAPASIFNVLWAAYLRADSSTTDPTAEQFGRMLLGALDGAEALRLWNEK